MNIVERAEAAIARLLLSATSVDRDVREEADDAVKALIAFINAPPRHKFWGAGESDCPHEIKAGNGELHTLRCKVCGADNPSSEICRATSPTQGGS